MKRRPTTSVLLAIGVTVAAVMLSSGLGQALHRQSPPFIEVSGQIGGDVGRIDAWKPDFWAFQSSGDIIGNGNADGNIFQYEHALRVLGGALGIKQVSCGPFAASNPSVSKRRDLIAFEADGGLCAFAQNNCDSLAAPTTGRQIFLYSPDTGQISQVTSCAGDCMNPHLAGNGKFLVFDSTTNLIGAGGIGTVRELYQADLRRLGVACPTIPCGAGPADPGVKRLTNGGGQNGTQSFNGRIVAFESSGDLLNGGANPGVQHVYVFDTRKGTLQQLSTGNLEARAPDSNQSGRFIAFEQDTVPVGGGVPMSQIYFAKIRRQKTTITPITAGGLDSFGASIDPRGRRVAFTSAADLLGLGAPGNQVYTYNVRRDELVQLTAGPNGSGLVDSTTATLLGLRSSDDFVGNGNSTGQFFVANFFRRAPGSVPSILPGTPTPGGIPATPTPTATPIAGLPVDIGLALVGDIAVDNGNNTLTTVIAATVGDFYANPVPDGTWVNFTVEFPAGGVLVTNGRTNMDPDCDVTAFEAATGIDIINRAGVAHSCVTYPGGVAGTTRTVTARSGGSSEMACVGGSNPGATCVIDFDCPEGSCELVDPGAIESGTIQLPFMAPANCTVNGEPCSDANPCTVGDVCAGGLPDMFCVGGTNDGAACTVPGQCPDLRECFQGSNHGLPCVTDIDCPFGSCQLTSAGECVLTTPPTCQSGTPVSCSDDGDACTVDVCDFFTGECGVAAECPDDGNPCTDDVCDALTGACGVSNTATCDDGDLCTDDDVCLGGSCQPGTAVTCADDGNACTADVCNPVDGTCGIRVEPCGCSAP